MTQQKGHSRLSAAELKRMIPDAARVATHLYGIEFRNNVARCPFTEHHNHGDRNPSLRYDRKKKRIFCASQLCFGAKGVDAIGFVQHMDRCDFQSALVKLATRYSVPTMSRNVPSKPRRSRAESNGSNGALTNEKMIPADAVRAKLQRGGFEVVAEFSYGPELRKVRFEHKSNRQEDEERPEKTFRWEHFRDGSWYSGDGGKAKPLYVNSTFRERDQIGLVLGFEGEAKADLAAVFGIPAFSFKDLTSEPALTFADCDVVLWPDNDASGQAQAIAAAAVIHDSDCVRSLKLLKPPPEFPAAADIIDAVNELKWGRAQIMQLIDAAAPYVDVRSYVGKAEPDGTQEGHAGESQQHQRFQVSDEGVFFLKVTERDVELIRLAARVDVVAQTRDASSTNWGRLLKWYDNEGREHRWAMPMELLASDATAVRAHLLGEGLPFITTNARYRERLTEYLQTALTEQRLLCVSRLGWCGNAYVLPDNTLRADDGEEILYQTPNETVHHWRVRGTAEQWREHVGQLCRGNSRLILTVSCGFAGPLLSIANAESGGIHLRSTSSTGKTTALFVGSSVCGGGGTRGFLQTWRSTVNGLEAIAELHNDGTLFLDELAQADPREAAETAYLLANGQGKARMTRAISTRRKLNWRLLFVSTGEVTLAEHAATAGKRVKAGADVRFLNIPADAGVGLGLFETLHGAVSAEAFANQLRDAALHYYGAPLRSFIAQLIRNRATAEQSIHFARQSLFRVIPTDASGQVLRAAERFALIGAAGELASRWGLTGWVEGEAIQAAQRCFKDWLAARGTAGNSDVEACISRLRAFLGAHGSGRFQRLRPSRGDDEDAETVGVEFIRDRAGFRQRNPDTDQPEYLIFLDVFRAEICAGHDWQAVSKELDKRGFLRRQGREMTIKPRLPELGPTRVYCIRAAILGSDEC